MYKNFYVTLLNNVLVEGKQNGLGELANAMPKPVSLDEGWEVGVSQIQFKNIMKFRTPEFKFVAFIVNAADEDELDREELGDDYEEFDAYVLPEAATIATPHEFRHLHYVTGVNVIDNSAWTTTYAQFITVPAGLWNTPDEVGKAVARILQAAFRLNISFRPSYDSARKFYVGDSRNLYLGFSSSSDELFEMLKIFPRGESQLLKQKLFLYGFRDTNWTFRSYNNPIIKCINVYSQMIQKQVVGKQLNRLLKSVPVTVAREQQQVNFYFKPTYQKLERTTLTEISICLLDEQGKALEFESSRCSVAVQLHFRKRCTLSLC